MGAKELLYITAEDYLASERLATEKHEYFEGEIFAMSGASFPHNEIVGNTFGNLFIELKGKKCRAYVGDLRIHIPKNTLYTYPDIAVICGEKDATDDKFDTATNPTVLFEILSRSTQKYDRTGKFDLYRDIDTLKEYIMINSEKIQVLKYSRNPDNSWLLTIFESLEDVFIIQSIDVELKLSDIYFDVKFKNVD